jgi:hypothetical protein
VQFLGSYESVSSELVETATQVSVTPVQYLNLDTSFQFSTDPSDYISPLGPLTIGSCATDPTNANCSTPPPLSSPTSTQQIPPLPIENFFGETSAQTFLQNTIATATATTTGGAIVSASAIYDAIVAAEVVVCSW